MVDFEGEKLSEYPNYIFYTDGSIYSTFVWRLLNQYVFYAHPTVPYYGTHLRRKDGKHMTVFVHRLIAEAFLGPSPFDGAQVRHLDGNGLNNHYTNLAWGSAKENFDDSKRLGRVAEGTKHGHAKLTLEQVKEIKCRVGLIRGQDKHIAEEFGVSRSLVSLIKTGKVWRVMK